MTTPEPPPPRYLATIQLKPSIELLSDEYDERDLDRYFIVQIIFGKHYTYGAQLLSEAMLSCGFTVQKNEFKDVKEVTDALESLKKKIEKQRKPAGVFVIVLCDGKEGEDGAGKLYADDGDKIAFDSVWDIFLNIPKLNRLPKLFLFQTHLPLKRTYDAEHFDGADKDRKLYDIPAPGADLFLICRTIPKEINKDIKDHFITTFCEHVKNHGHYADIFEIVTFSNSVQRPLIVSTLTAKFFFKKSTIGKHRHYNYLIQKDLNDILDKANKK